MAVPSLEDLRQAPVLAGRACTSLTVLEGVIPSMYWQQSKEKVKKSTALTLVLPVYKKAWTGLRVVWACLAGWECREPPPAAPRGPAPPVEGLASHSKIILINYSCKQVALPSNIMLWTDLNIVLAVICGIDLLTNNHQYSENKSNISVTVSK